MSDDRAVSDRGTQNRLPWWAFHRGADQPAQKISPTVGRQLPPESEGRALGYRAETVGRQDASRVDPPFFEISREAARLRAWAAADAYKQWVAFRNDWVKMAVDEMTAGLVQVSTAADHFNPAFSRDLDYLEQFYTRLESYFLRPPWVEANMVVGVRALTRFVVAMFPQLAKSGTRLVAGLYRIGSTGGSRGHHIFLKKAFPEAIRNRMFAISQEAMAALRWNHDAMTRVQRDLYRQLARRGTHTMRDHIDIAYRALRAGNATHEQARWLVAQALRNLRAAGIRSASRVPVW